MNTLALFSHEVRNAGETAQLMVQHNNQRIGSPRLVWERVTVQAADGGTIQVAWAMPEKTGQVYVCWWSTQQEKEE